MGKKMAAFALAALLTLGLSGCGSGNNVTTDRSYGTRGTYGTNDSYNNGTNGNNGMMGNNGSMDNGSARSNGSNGTGSMNGTGGSNGRGIMGDIGNGIDNTMDDIGDAIRDAGDTLSGDSRRYQQMLENGRVHDTDGYLLDGENRHD